MDSSRVIRLPVPQQQGQRVEPFVPFFASQMEGREPRPREWLIDGVIQRRTVNLFAGPPKIGKCVGKGTPILMFDGSVKKVEDIKVNDLLMGPDSTPRSVLELSHGTGPLFRVVPNKGDPYVINSEHVLSLRYTPTRKQRLFPFPVNIPVRKYLGLSNHQKHHLKGWRCGVEWDHRDLEISPYLLGLWLGDGTSGFPEITSANPEIILPALQEFAEGTNLRIVERAHSGAAQAYRLSTSKGRPNEFSSALKILGVFTDKQIPQTYLVNSEQNRLELLAGLLDTDGHLCKGTANCFEITQKRETLAEQIVFLARSLGFSAYRKLTMKKSQESDLRPYYRVLIGGDIDRIPVRLPHKKAKPKKSKHRDGLLTGIRVEPIGEGEFFGFEVDGDHLFLLGDFTVTHNSLLLQQQLTATAAGVPWLERETVKTKSFGLYTEDPQEEIERRQKDINELYGRSPADYALDLAWESRPDRDAVMVHFDRWSTKPVLTPLWHQFWAFVAENGYQLIGLDNARVIFGGSEINPQQVTAFVRLLVQQAIAIDGAIVLAAHPAKSDPKGFAGTGAWLASVRSGMSLHRPSSYDEERDGMMDPRRVLVGIGANYGAGIGVEHVEYRDGVFQLRDDDDRPKRRAPLTQIERTDLKYRIIAGLKRVMENGGQVPADDANPKSMPYRARRSIDPQINRVPLNELIAAQQELIDSGQLVRVIVSGRVLIRPIDVKYPDEQGDA